MQEVFRKHYSYGETLPILDTYVEITCDFYEVNGKTAPVGPCIKGMFCASAGPFKSLPVIVDALTENDSQLIHLTNIPVSATAARTVDVSLICDVLNYRWTIAPELPRDCGVVTFDLRCRCAFSIDGKTYALLLDQRPCAITLTKQLLPLRMPVLDQREMTPADNVAETAARVTDQLDVEEHLRQLGTKLLARA
jgi:hypothetical protein